VAEQSVEGAALRMVCASSQKPAGCGCCADAALEINHLRERKNLI
jgi:hypothetical protein